MKTYNIDKLIEKLIDLQVAGYEELTELQLQWFVLDEDGDDLVEFFKNHRKGDETS